MFYQRYTELCEKHGERPYALVLKLGAKSNSIVDQWKKGSSPRPEMIKKIAEYFSVSVSYLMGLENEKSPAPEGAERIPNYDKLNGTNRAIVDSMIAQLLAAQSED